MGLLDKNITITYLEGKVPLEDLFELLKEKLGSKYEVKFLKKGNTAAQFLGTGSANDRIFIAKNAYHRTLITTKYAPMTDDMSGISVVSRQMFELASHMCHASQ